MPRIQCPRCKAVNQDVTPNDKCWMCEQKLGAGVSDASPKTVVSPDQSENGNGAILKESQMPAPTPKFSLMEQKAQKQLSKPATKKSPILAITILAIVLIVITILVIMFLQHKP